MDFQQQVRMLHISLIQKLEMGLLPQLQLLLMTQQKKQEQDFMI